MEGDGKSRTDVAIFQFVDLPITSSGDSWSASLHLVTKVSELAQPK